MEAGRWGQPRSRSGGSSVVFSMTCADGRRFAVKCFTRHVLDQEKRYQEISNHLSSIAPRGLSSHWNVEFEYLPMGVQVDNCWFPALKMEWVEGDTLLQWLDSHCQERKSVQAVAGRFKDLMESLSAAGIEHGDLQHGNILVAPDGTLRLVDYDGFYVPALSGLMGTELGHRNYQSPERRVEDFGPGVDNFSAWVIYLSLSAVAIDPSLWGQLHEPDAEHLLLERADFDAPGSSVRFLTLLQHPDSRVRELAQAVVAMIDRPLAELPGLGQGSESAGMEDDGERVAKENKEDVDSSRSGRPAWLQNHLSTINGNPRPPARGGRTFQGRRFRDTTLAACAVPLSLLAPILGMVGVLGVDLACTAALGVVGLLVVAAVLGWRSRAELGEMMSDSQAVSQLLSHIGDPAADYSQLAAERERLEDEESKRILLFTERQRELTQRLQREHAQVEGEMRAALILLEAEQTKLSAARQAAVDKAAEPFQRNWIESQLENFEIGRAYLAIGGEKVLQALTGAGIRTAADYTGFRIGGSGALLIRRDGEAVRVLGVGSYRAAVLQKWRDRRVAELSRQCPIGLPEQSVREVEGRFASQFRAVSDRRRDVEDSARAAKDRITVQIGNEREKLVELNKPAAEAAYAMGKEFDRRAAQLRSRGIELQSLMRESSILEEQRRALSFWRYVRFLF